jgi:hypothetical protein
MLKNADGSTADVHRFHDRVALHVGKGETVYVTRAVARKLARALNACERDIGKHTFTGSSFGSVNIDLNETE